MSYQQISIETNKLEFVRQNYHDQITALKLFFRDAFPKNLNLDVVKFGGGTALCVYYFQHRLSFDIDLFLTDQQYLSYFSPKHWIEDSSYFDNIHYIDTHKHIGVVSANNIKVDVLVDASSSSKLIDNTKLIFPFDIRIESIEDILSKKIVFRKKDNKARDIFDIAVALQNDTKILKKLLQNQRVNKDDLITFAEALKSIDTTKYNIAIDMIEPIKKYQSLAQNAPSFILEALRQII